MKSRLIFLFLLLTGCQEERGKVELISRRHDQKTTIPPLVIQDRPPYFWETQNKNGIAEITKEYFRCKGNAMNPAKSELVRGERVRYQDCSSRHSLPLIHGKEGVYPILIDLLNYVQEKTGRQVIITSGHRCPEHNTYIDPSLQNQYSKHQIGAEVDFYVQGFETRPQTIVDIIMSYYPPGDFKRYEKEVNTETKPWMNKEIFIKLFKSKEGRNADNRHPYPYISIQVRYDNDQKKPVSYSWEQAFGNYLRY